MRRKENLVCLIAGIGAVLIALGFIIFGMIQKEKEIAPDEVLGSEPGKSSWLSDAEDSTVPPIIPSEKEHIRQESGEVHVDVSEMTRNPDAEVVSCEVGYETKEKSKNE